MAATADREKALATALQQIEKQHGKALSCALASRRPLRSPLSPRARWPSTSRWVSEAPTWQDRGDLWSRILRQDDGGFARNR